MIAAAHDLLERERELTALEAAIDDAGAGNGSMVVIAGPAGGGVFRIGLPATSGAEYERLVGLIAAQPFVDTVLPGRKPDDGG